MAVVPTPPLNSYCERNVAISSNIMRLLRCSTTRNDEKICHYPELNSESINADLKPLTLPCLVFAPRSQSFANIALQWYAQSARYPDSLRYVRTQIRSPKRGEEKRSKAAFTKPSRGMSEAKDALQSTETLSFRCWSECCRLMRGAVDISKSKVAFTLAEVLITLGIIGVVAAMTMPTIISKVQANILKQQFKKTYNTFSNALLKTYVDNGNEYFECYYAEVLSGGTCLEYNEKGDCINNSSSSGYDYNSGCNAFADELKSALKVIKVCENNALKNGCISADMKGFDTVYKETHEGISDLDANKETAGCSAFREQNIKNYNETWVLADGIIVGLYPSLRGKIFWVDINGQKRPNKWGYDIFTFRFKQNAESVKLYSAGCMLPEKGGVSSDTMVKTMH